MKLLRFMSRLPLLLVGFFCFSNLVAMALYLTEGSGLHAANLARLCIGLVVFVVLWALQKGSPGRRSDVVTTVRKPDPMVCRDCGKAREPGARQCHDCGCEGAIIQSVWEARQRRVAETVDAAKDDVQSQ